MSGRCHFVISVILTVAEEESESSGSGFGRGNSRQSSVNSAVEDKNKKIGKKKAGLLKGLGSMFRLVQEFQGKMCVLLVCGSDVETTNVRDTKW